ncbi:MAG: glycosyl hydrolase family 39 [Silvibacterium sp.]|nr:glycosyl hydrolase family 39 [Silvibacterium sp.]
MQKVNRLVSLVLGLALLSPAAALSLLAQEQVEIDAAAPATPFPHFWEQMFGSGRANLTLRESYRDDLRAVKQVADFRYVRFHAILHDENGVYNEDEHGNPVYNFAYVDQIYDGLLKNGVRPFVEISFMPKKLAFNPDALHPFWYKQNVSPPKSMERWDGLITAFAQHLVERYGIDEVSQWYFEVWNEPNIDFWDGIPRKKSYFDLYAHTARALKAVSPRLRVGGPASSAAYWIPDFLKYCADNHVPVDFVSTHGYSDDTVQDLFGPNEEVRPSDLPPNFPKDIPMDERVPRAIAKVRGQIQVSPLPNLPLMWTEWNVQGMNESRDTIFVGPALANTFRQCSGVDMLSFWTFSDVFEEGGPSPKPFEGQFGLRAKGGINKPSYYAYGLLHQLGNQRLANPSNNVIVTKSADGSLAVAAWNLVDPDKQGTAHTMTLTFRGVLPNASITTQRVDSEHGNVLPRYAAMGKPLDPTPAQVEQLNRETELPAPEQSTLNNGKLELQLTPNALVLIKVQPK